MSLLKTNGDLPYRGSKDHAEDNMLYALASSYLQTDQMLQDARKQKQWETMASCFMQQAALQEAMTKLVILKNQGQLDSGFLTFGREVCTRMKEELRVAKNKKEGHSEPQSKGESGTGEGDPGGAGSSPPPTEGAGS
jgi:hypothetical protein